jgi:AcrR family transcriptional regulator
MTTMSEASPGDRPVGLRERKKARTRAAIREHALRLFREHGYDATTVEQIAEAAEVSPSTFFRYFPTKEDVVLQDDFDVIGLQAFEAQPPEMSPFAAYRAAMVQTFMSLSPEERDRFRETMELTLTVPEVRARALDELARSVDAVAAAFARRTGRAADDLAVRNAAGAVIGVVLAATLPWAGQPAADTLARIDAALVHLEAGLPL